MTSERRTGPVLVSRALLRAAAIVDADYPPAHWDVLLVLFGRGLRPNDTESIDLVRERLLPRILAFGYAQFADPPGTVSDGPLIKEMEKAFMAERRVLTTYLAHEGEFAAVFAARVEALVAG
jgi:uncharacterized sporulation protein YeaH/YhbH (DUF444 family)